MNALIAVLVIKGILTRDEGDALVEHLNDKPQSTVLADAITVISEIIAPPATAAQLPLGPVGPTQQAEELAARSQPQPVLPQVAPPIDQEETKPETVPPKPETDKNSKDTPVKKVTDKDAKK
jgi:hypothetical protein